MGAGRRGWLWAQIQEAIWTAEQEEPMMTEKETRAMLVECLHGEMRDAILDEIKAAPDVWQKLAQAKQEEVIDRVEPKSV